MASTDSDFQNSNSNHEEIVLKKIGQYKLKKEIGRGAFATVYKGYIIQPKINPKKYMQLNKYLGKLLIKNYMTLLKKKLTFCNQSIKKT